MAFWKKKVSENIEEQQQRLSKEDMLYFEYLFKFEDGEKHDITIYLHPETLQYMPQQDISGDEWTRLEHHQCESCPLDPAESPHCPIALSIEDLVREFSDKFSYEEADMKVHTKDRSYFRHTTMQKTVSSLMGILMVSSGCPIMDKLRPMVRFHLPWATVIETTFRTTSTYLLGQFLLQAADMEFDYSFSGLVEIYKGVNTVNKGIAKRIGSMAGKDASINALIILDIFAVDIPLSIEEQIEELRPFFKSYFA
jgi:hypothetical protein